MNRFKEYDGLVRHPLSATVLLFSLIAFLAAFVPGSHAQINGAPSSVTSPGFGGRAVNGPPASVTSLGPRGYAPNPNVTFSTAVPNGNRGFRNRGNNNVRRRRRHYGDYGYGGYGGPLMYAVPVPYAVDAAPDAPYDDNSDSPDIDNDPGYQGGPTVFDRRGRGERSYIPPANDVARDRGTQPAQAAQDSSADASDSAETQDPTTLVFKDGHQLDVTNYAIVGTTLFDLTPGHARKVALADLDLDATRKQNDNRGVLFQLPPSAQAN
jgi:hypothetical protein